ncbi:MAG TPA: biotin transporter BioY [Dermatophilaceae bacterium]|nr:biotin transporter BioY [Dermatophilaceae bacterium]
MSATDLALVATFAGLIAVLGVAGTVYPFGGAAPITAQTLGVMLAGAILGGRRGAAAVLVFIALVAAGLPLLAGGRGGLGVFAGPTVGYLLGWVVGAFVVGLLIQLKLPRPALWWAILACLVGGVGGIYLLGIPGVAWRTQIPIGTAAKAAAAFLPGDLIKAVVAAVVAGAVHRASPGLTQPLRLARRPRR